MSQGEQRSHAPSFVWLEGGQTQRLVTLSVHERNRRIVSRASHTLIDTLSTCTTNAIVMCVPEHVALERGFFETLDTTSFDTPTLLTTTDASTEKPWLLIGPAARMSELFHQLKQPEQFAPTAAILPTQTISSELIFSVSTDKNRVDAERRMIKHCGKPNDGVVAKAINRPVSQFLSFYALRLGLKPIHGTYINFLIGLAAIYYALQTDWYALPLAGIFFQLNSIVDGVDGEMARVTLGESKAGARLDSVFDHIIYVGGLVAVLLGWWRAGMNPLEQLTALVVIIGVPLVVGVELLFVKRYLAGPDARFVDLFTRLGFLPHAIAHAAKAEATPSLKAASAMYFALKRDVFALVFMFVGFTGSRLLFGALTVCMVLVVVYTFAAHHKTLSKHLQTA